MLIGCNILIPQLLWIRKVRLNVPLLFLLSLVINVGMWLERFVIVITSLHRDWLPSSWGEYHPTFDRLGDLHWYHRLLPDADVYLRPYPARHFDLRNARGAAPSQTWSRHYSGEKASSEPGAWRLDMSETFWDRHGFYGLMAEFTEGEELVAATERAYGRGLPEDGCLFPSAGRRPFGSDWVPPQPGFTDRVHRRHFRLHGRLWVVVWITRLPMRTT